MSIQQYEFRFTQIEMEDTQEIDINDFQEKVYQLEKEVLEALDFSFSKEKRQLKSLLKRIAQFKKENDFYDSEAELDRMFPNRHDDDFDEDSDL